MTTPVGNHPVWLEGVGFLDQHGHFYTEDQVRAAVKVANNAIKWFNALSEDFRAAAIEIAEIDATLNRIAEENA